LIAHRLSTIERAPLVAVLDHGRVVQSGARAELAVSPGPFRDLLRASRTGHDGLNDDVTGDLVDEPADAPEEPAEVQHATLDQAEVGVPDAGVGGRRRTGPPPEQPEIGDGPSLARGIAHALLIRPVWGVLGALMFLLASLTGAQGAVTGLVWGRIVEGLEAGTVSPPMVGALVISLIAAPLMLADA